MRAVSGWSLALWRRAFVLVSAWCSEPPRSLLRFVAAGSPRRAPSLRLLLQKYYPVSFPPTRPLRIAIAPDTSRLVSESEPRGPRRNSAAKNKDASMLLLGFVRTSSPSSRKRRCFLIARVAWELATFGRKLPETPPQKTVAMQ